MAIFPAAACSLQSMNYCRVVTELIVFLNHTQKTKETKNWTKLFELNSPRYGAKQSASDSHVVFICKKIASRWLYGKVTRKIIGGDQAGRFEKHKFISHFFSRKARKRSRIWGIRRHTPTKNSWEYTPRVLRHTSIEFYDNPNSND